MSTVSEEPDQRPVFQPKIALAAVFGTTVEWYDFALYGTAAALVFNKVYFPDGDPLVGTILAYGTFAIGFLARPLGGAYFGEKGDTKRRKDVELWEVTRGIRVGLPARVLAWLVA